LGTTAKMRRRFGAKVEEKVRMVGVVVQLVVVPMPAKRMRVKLPEIARLA
jgi:hypothetical protein